MAPAPFEILISLRSKETACPVAKNIVNVVDFHANVSNLSRSRDVGRVCVNVFVSIKSPMCKIMLQFSMCTCSCESPGKICIPSVL